MLVHVRDLEQIILDRIEYPSELSGQHHFANFSSLALRKAELCSQSNKSTIVQPLFNTCAMMDQRHGRFFSCNQRWMTKEKRTRQRQVHPFFILTNSAIDHRCPMDFVRSGFQLADTPRQQLSACIFYRYSSSCYRKLRRSPGLVRDQSHRQPLRILVISLINE